MLELSCKEWLGKHVSWILQSVNFIHHNLSYINTLSNEVVLNTNMLGLKVVNLILGKISNAM